MDTLAEKLAPLQDQFSTELANRRADAEEAFARFEAAHAADPRFDGLKPWRAPYVDAFARAVAPEMSVEDVELVLGQALVKYYDSDWLVVGDDDGRPVFGAYAPGRRFAHLPGTYARDVVNGTQYRYFGLHWTEDFTFPEENEGEWAEQYRHLVEAFYYLIAHPEATVKEALESVQGASESSAELEAELTKLAEEHL